MLKKSALALVILAATVAPALAHFNPEEHGSFAAGFSHPLFGLDHILAMVAVGLWAALLKQTQEKWKPVFRPGSGGETLPFLRQDENFGRSVWLVPAAFVGTMMAGFAAALAGLGLPFVEPVIAASVVVIGLLALVALQVPTIVGMAMVGFFAFFHGYAHGGELGDAGAWPFALGFALATALLHAIGVGIGFVAGRLAGGSAGRLLTRVAGGLTALGGLWLATGA